MVGIRDVADGIVTHRRLVVIGLLVLIAAVGVGAAEVEESSSFSQFETDSTEAEKLDYVESNFGTSSNTTTAQVIVRGENVLSRPALLDQLRFQRTLTENETVNRTLSTEQRPAGIATVVATAAIREEQAANLSRRGAALQAEQARLNETGAALSDALNRTRRLEHSYTELNRSAARGEIDDATYRQRAAAIERNLTATRETATANLSSESAATFGDLFAQTRDLQSRLDSLNASYAQGEINQSTYRQRAGEIQQGFGETYAGIEQVLAPQAQALQERAETLQADQATLQERVENGSTPSIEAQIDQLESMNASAVEGTVGEVLSEGSGSGAFALMPTDYEPGSTSAEATMIVLTQTTRTETAQGSASARIQESQIAVQEIARAELDGEGLVFGAGIIADEMSRSMQDSLVVVGPIAILFVLLVLTVAYRDVIDILLGISGIGLVLAIAFGFMGWFDVAFNQLFVAIPVLLIGLSIDYAIHVFMRHREERTPLEAVADGGDGPSGDNDASDSHASDSDTGDATAAGSMRTALAGVGAALILVTATTVIGFLSNLTSPVGPIREFGLVSAAGIVGALVVFGALVPAVKVEIDELLEGYGFDRRKAAFGTGGGRFGQLLEVGSTVARRAPTAVIVLTLLVSAAGAYGATQVDTSFANEDFIAEEPPEWMDSLPEEMRPGEYSMRATFEYVNDNFLREDSTAEFLYEGDVATADALDRVDRTRAGVANKSVTVTLSNGEPDIRSPLTVMESVAATNETFNATLAASDTDGDGVPDRNVAGVYDSLFATAPEQASNVIDRENGDYRALRLTASIRGGASGDAITNQMNDVEGSVERGTGGDLTITATGTPIVNKIVQDDLLQTVVESLVITLVASFIFLMVVYRLIEDSATLGLVTLLPVVFNVSWILGTMYLLDIPFNVLTGMITSLTIGLGVAYSIHISERYSLELDRQGSAFPAMRTAVTGTGGALLGSAATTVGGFGVLVFAILPPLQQFGFITGLTIVYAFFASVFVLPSLLVVWTRYLGPDDAFGPSDEPDTRDDGSTPADGVREPAAGGAPDAPVATSEVAESPSGSVTNGDAVVTNGAPAAAQSTADATGRDTAVTGAPAPTPRPRTNGHGRLFATRSVDPSRVRPGDTVSVTVTLPSAGGRVVVDESPPGTDTRIESVTPDPVEAVATAEGVYAVWDLEEVGTATVEYETTVPVDVGDGETLTFAGEALFPDHVVDVAGADGVTVTTDVAGSIFADGSVSDQDLADAGHHLGAGTLSAAEFERAYHAWLDDHASATAPEEADDD
jgi:predicted RND superfamily exporter protein